MQLSKNQYKTIQTIPGSFAPKANIWLFGSRITNTAKKYADLDILIKQNKAMPLKTIAALRTAFDESSLPFKVDIIDWHRISPEFRETIQPTCMPFDLSSDLFLFNSSENLKIT